MSSQFQTSSVIQKLNLAIKSQSPSNQRKPDRQQNLQELRRMLREAIYRAKNSSSYIYSPSEMSDAFEGLKCMQSLRFSSRLTPSTHFQMLLNEVLFSTQEIAQHSRVIKRYESWNGFTQSCLSKPCNNNDLIAPTINILPFEKPSTIRKSVRPRVETPSELRTLISGLMQKI